MGYTQTHSVEYGLRSNTSSAALFRIDPRVCRLASTEHMVSENSGMDCSDLQASFVLSYEDSLGRPISCHHLFCSPSVSSLSANPSVADPTTKPSLLVRPPPPPFRRSEPFRSPPFFFVFVSTFVVFRCDSLRPWTWGTRERAPARGAPTPFPVRLLHPAGRAPGRPGVAGGG